jgi:hypothetical protein
LPEHMRQSFALFGFGEAERSDGGRETL